MPENAQSQSLACLTKLCRRCAPVLSPVSRKCGSKSHCFAFLNWHNIQQHVKVDKCNKAHKLQVMISQVATALTYRRNSYISHAFIHHQPSRQHTVTSIIYHLVHNSYHTVEAKSNIQKDNKSYIFESWWRESSRCRFAQHSRANGSITWLDRTIEYHTRTSWLKSTSRTGSAPISLEQLEEIYQVSRFVSPRGSPVQ